MTQKLATIDHQTAQKKTEENIIATDYFQCNFKLSWAIYYRVTEFFAAYSKINQILLKHDVELLKKETIGWYL